MPTVAEAGVPGYEAMSWIGLLAPAGDAAGGRSTSCGTRVARRCASRTVRDTLLRDGSEIVASKPEEFRAGDRERLREIRQARDLFKSVK